MDRKPYRLGRCAVCNHREATAINLALARGVSVRALSKRYGPSTDSLYRHSRSHLPPHLRAKLIAGPSVEGLDLDRLRETESQSLLMNLIGLRNRLLASLDVAEENADTGQIAKIVSALHRNLEITGELLGDLTTGTTNITNVVMLPAYVQMRLELVKALAPFPEARLAAAKVLHRIESKAAEQITDNAEKGLAR